MHLTALRKSLRFAAAILWLAALPASGQSSSQPSTKSGEWPHYTADLKGTKYSPVDQINAWNFNNLEIAWRLKKNNFGIRPEYKLEGALLMIKGVLYATPGTCRDVNTGQPGSVGLIVTKSPVILGDAQVPPVTHAHGSMLRAYDTGLARESAQSGCPRRRAGRP